LAGEEPLDPVAPVGPLPGVDAGLLVPFGTVGVGVLVFGVVVFGVVVVVVVVVFVVVLPALPEAACVDPVVLGAYSRNGFGSAPWRMVAWVLVVSRAASS
jgi:hypothetical protein